MNKDFVNRLGAPGGKMTLDIGGQKKGFAKKPRQDDGEWGNFGGIGLPAGFEAPPGMEPPQQTTGSSSFGSEFDAPPKQQEASIDFFGGDEPTPVKASGDLLGGSDLLSGPATTNTTMSTPATQPSIESLYQQQGMMNTNQLLFNTAVQQQSYAQSQIPAVGGFGTMTNTSANQLLGTPATTSVANVTSASLPFNTGLGLNQMFATGVPGAGFATGVSAINAPAFPVTMNTGMGVPGMNLDAGITMNTGVNTMNNPNFQVGSGFQTGSINLNQLYQTQAGTSQQPNVAASIAELTSLTTSSQQKNPGLTFATTAGGAQQPVSGAFNTTVPAANKDIFDLM